MTNKLLLFFIYCSLSSAHAQNNDVIEWINKNAVVIEDADPDTQLTAFAENVPVNFNNARIFGFGEASHHGKEFFDVKAKFFKYLVQHHGVTLFLMEESYQSERGINDYISGGEGDPKSVRNNFSQGIWRSNEVGALLQWMREYNQGKTYNEQIRFYGIDNQFGHDISTRVRNYIKKHKIVIDEEILAAADSCSAAQQKVRGIKHWDKKMLPKLTQIRHTLEQNREKLIATNKNEYNDMLRGLGYLEQYTAFIAAPYSQIRDKDMFDNALKVVETEAPGAKAFLWAHNEHINKKNLGGYKIENLGSRLKKHFKEEYYATGFDFGGGSLIGFDIKNGKVLAKVLRTLDKPYKKTFAETLVQAKPNIYFVDISTALAHPAAAKFFSSKKEQLFLGGPGFDPKNNFFIKRSIAEAYDGIIFIRSISPPKPDK